MPFSALRRRCRQAFKTVLFASLATVSSLAQADINSVTASPSSVSIQANTGGSVNVTWQVNRTETDVARIFHTRTVSSPSALLQINGATIATLAGNLSTTSTLQGGISASETVSLSESYSLNAALARQVARSAAGSVRLVRTFDDTPNMTPVSAAVSVFARGTATGPLSVRRINLAFENNARTDVVYQGDSIHAIADVAFNSSGILKGEWRIVDPTASLGAGGGRVLRVVRQNLVSSGQGRTGIVSPALPTDTKGLYLVSFVVEDANTNFDMPILRYFVLDKQEATMATAPASMATLSPAMGSALNQDTVFSWQAVQGALAYQIELFNPGQNTPITGKLVTAAQQQLSLQAFSFDWLQSGQPYDWRVRAFGVGGKLLAQSEMQLIYLP